MPSEKKEEKEESLKDRLVPFENTEVLFDEKNKKAYQKLFTNPIKDTKYIMKYLHYDLEFPIQFKKMIYNKIKDEKGKDIDEKDQPTLYHFIITQSKLGMFGYPFNKFIKNETENGRTTLNLDFFCTPNELEKPSDFTFYPWYDKKSPDKKSPIEWIPSKNKIYLLKLDVAMENKTSTSYIEVQLDHIIWFPYIPESSDRTDMVNIYKFNIKNPEKLTPQEKNDISFLPPLHEFQSNDKIIYILPKYFDKNVKTTVKASLYKPPVSYNTQKKRQKLMDDVGESIPQIPKEVFTKEILGFLKGTTTGKTVGKKGGKNKTKKHR